VGIHIRRGDFLHIFSIDTSVSYLLSSIEYYRKKYANCRFVVGSDDKVYAQKNLGNLSDVIVLPSWLSVGGDLAALCLCEHTILTAGSYGWWVAWLTGGNVVHDINYPVPFQNCPREDYFPPWFLFPHNSSSKQYKP
jgi:galactoside 2-L-fucosyltransferase 1/2